VINFIAILLIVPLLSTPAEPDTLTFSPIGGELEGATDVSVVQTGRLYITERTKHRFLVLNSTGMRIDSVGSQGRGDYRFDRPAAIDATNGLKIYLADENNGRVQMYDRRHQFLTSITSEKVDRRFSFTPSDLVVSPANELFVYDSESFLIYIFDSNGNFTGEINLRQYGVRTVTQLGIAGSFLLLLDGPNGVIHRFRTDGGYINFIGGLQNAQAFSGSEDDLWVLFGNRIGRYTPRGGEISTFLLEQPLQNPVDIDVNGPFIYILTENQLYRTVIQ
jgi:hypothetical protein